jgi:hypothetical protein
VGVALALHNEVPNIVERENHFAKWVDRRRWEGRMEDFIPQRLRAAETRSAEGVRQNRETGPEWRSHIFRKTFKVSDQQSALSRTSHFVLFYTIVLTFDKDSELHR